MLISRRLINDIKTNQKRAETAKNNNENPKIETIAENNHF